MEALDIAEVRRRTGLSASALRYYEGRGLITSSGRHGLRRQYAPEVIERLAVILLFRACGFSLDDAAAFLQTGGHARWKEIGRARYDELGHRIVHLQRMRERLREALDCPSPNIYQCAHFQQALSEVLAAGGHEGPAALAAGGQEQPRAPADDPADPSLPPAADASAQH